MLFEVWQPRYSAKPWLLSMAWWGTVTGRVVGVYQRNVRDVVATIVAPAGDDRALDSEDAVLAVPMDPRWVHKLLLWASCPEAAVCLCLRMCMCVVERVWVCVCGQRGGGRLPKVRVRTRQAALLAGQRLVIAIDGWERYVARARSTGASSSGDGAVPPFVLCCVPLAACALPPPPQ